MTSQRSKHSVALVVPAFATSGGVRVVTQFLHRILTDSGRYEPAIISLATSARDANSVRLLSPPSWVRGIQISTETSHGVTFQHVGAFLVEFEFLRYQTRRKLCELLQGYDLVQVVSGFPTVALAVTDCQKPVILQVATLVTMERATMLQWDSKMMKLWRTLMTKWTASLEHLAVQRVHTSFVENRWMYHYLCHRVGSAKVRFAPPGIDTDFFHPGPYQSDGYILSVGRFSDRRKNIRLLFDAYHRLRQLLPSVPALVLAGKSPVAADWNYAETLGIIDRIQVYENVGMDTLADLYRGASLFVLPSDEEGLGLVLIEAMASGIPVLSTRCGGPETTVIEGGTGYLTPVGDTQAMATCMLHMISDPALRMQMGRTGRQWAVDRFSLAVTGQPFLECYDALLAARS
jgi:glycosyltransferase involved in cell wall biosynthesis